MKVEVLFVVDCPSHLEAVRLVKHVLAAQGIATEIHEVIVTDERMADELRFFGSPTIRINGQDVAGESHSLQSSALSCRFHAGSKVVGLPPTELIHQAILDAQRGRKP